MTTDPDRPVCSCPPGRHVLSCDLHWDQVGAVRVRNATATTWPPTTPRRTT